MTISIEKKKFIEAVHTVTRFAERGLSSLPVLSSVLILAGDEGIKLRATNLETGVDFKMKGTHSGDGVMAIPARILEQIAGSLVGEGEVTLEKSGDTALFKSGSSRSIIKTMPYEDFPVIPLPESPKGRVVLAGAVIKNLLSSIASCASTSTIRPELASIYLAVEGGMCTAVATDSFRLAEKKITLGNKGVQSKVLIPAKNALDIAQALPDEEVIMSFDDHQCAFICEQGMFTTRLTSAVYPDYRQIIPKDSVAEAVVLRRDLELSLKRATIFSDTFQKIRLSFDPKKKTLALYSRNADVGESAEPIAGQVSGSAIELSFNHRYLSAFFTLTNTESVSLTASGVGRPLIMRGTGDASLLYLVMPMNQ
ncbi:MAG: DNA polymerase III subunit beta [bacterium]|nr:DNA polymerase III subunit beta [bacterium]